jgi:hypothetical protein
MSSPTKAGWRMIFRQPALVVGEIAWRWIFGLVITLLLAFSILTYLSTVEVPAPAIWLMSTHQPALVTGALIHMFRGSCWAAVKITLVGLPALGLIWIVLASLGRAATIQPMLTPGSEQEAGPRRALWPRLLGLSFLRFSVWFAANVACVGALTLAALLTSNSKHAVGIAILIFLVLTLAILVAWSCLNWLLSLASIFLVRDLSDAFDAISSAVDLLRRRFGALMKTSAVWGIVRSVAFVGSTFFAVAVLSLSGDVPPGYVLIAVLLITLAYLAFADLLYVGRLASYVSIIEDDLEPSPATPPVVPELPLADQSLPLSPELPALG